MSITVAQQYAGIVYAMHPTTLNLKTALIVNTHSRKGQQDFETASRLLVEKGYALQSYPLTDPRRLRSTVRKALADGCTLIVVGGGDGTMSEVVDDLAYQPAILGVLPLGTANSFARSLGIPADLQGAIEVISDGKVSEIDLGMINDDYFANTVSIGIGTVVAQNLTNVVKRYLGVLAYVWSGLKAFRSFTPFVATITEGDKSYSLSTFQIVIANGGSYGPASFLSKQYLKSGTVTVFTMKGVSLWRLLTSWIASMRGRTFSRQEIDHFAVREPVTIATSPSRKVSIDGEIKTKTPIKVSVAVKALKVLVPQEVPL
jgi:YegS/Rv2252/BmrU family lipid kinase